MPKENRFGGVAILCKSSLTVKPRPDLNVQFDQMKEEMENVWVEMPDS